MELPGASKTINCRDLRPLAMPAKIGITKLGQQFRIGMTIDVNLYFDEIPGSAPPLFLGTKVFLASPVQLPRGVLFRFLDRCPETILPDDPGWQLFACGTGSRFLMSSISAAADCLFPAAS